jgi:hypothetical protein
MSTRRDRLLFGALIPAVPQRLLTAALGAADPQLSATEVQILRPKREGLSDAQSSPGQGEE